MTWAHTAIAAAEAGNWDSHLTRIQQSRDEIAFIRVWKNKSGDLSGFDCHVIHMPMGLFRFVEMARQPRFQPAGPVGVSGIEINPPRQRSAKGTVSEDNGQLSI